MVASHYCQHQLCICVYSYNMYLQTLWLKIVNHFRVEVNIADTIEHACDAANYYVGLLLSLATPPNCIFLRINLC